MRGRQLISFFSCALWKWRRFSAWSYLIESADAIKKINDGDEVEIDYKAGVIKNKTTGVDISFNPLPDFALEIINDGGLLNHITKSKK